MRFFYINQSNQQVFSGSFTWASPFHNGLACVCDPYLGWLVINKDGGVVFRLPGFHNEATNVCDGMVRVTDGRKYGFVNSFGELVIEPQYFYAGEFSEGLAPVRIREGYNFVSKDGKLWLENSHSGLWGFCDKYALCKKSGKWYYLDHNSELIFGPYDFAHSFSGGVAQVVKNQKYLHIDAMGCVLFEGNEYTSAFCSEGRISFLSGEKAGFLDTYGRIVIKSIYDEVGPFSEGLSVVKKEKRIMVIDINGQLVFEAGCNVLESFHEGLAAFMKDGKWGYLNREGAVVVDASYVVASFFSEGMAVVATL